MVHLALGDPCPKETRTKDAGRGGGGGRSGSGGHLTRIIVAPLGLFREEKLRHQSVQRLITGRSLTFIPRRITRETEQLLTIAAVCDSLLV